MEYMFSYRNYEIPKDFREIQSYIVGTQRYKSNITEINLLDKNSTIIKWNAQEKI